MTNRTTHEGLAWFGVCLWLVVVYALIYGALI